MLTLTAPSCCNNTTLDNRLYARHKGPSVTNPICWTCKNCLYVCCWLWTLCHTTQHGAVLIIFPLNLQKSPKLGCCLAERRGQVFHKKWQASILTLTAAVQGRGLTSTVAVRGNVGKRLTVFRLLVRLWHCYLMTTNTENSQSQRILEFLWFFNVSCHASIFCLFCLSRAVV